MIKKILTVAMCSIILLAGSSKTAIAAEPKVAPVNIQIDYSSEKANIDGTTTYNVVNAKEVAAYYGVRNPKDVKVTLFNRERKAVSAPRSVYIDNVTGPREACGANEVTRNSAYNGSNMTVNKTITLTGNVSNTYSTNVQGGINVDVASISAGVGFDVTESWEMSDSTNVTLDPGESITVYAYPLYDVYRFDIVNDPLFGDSEKVGFGDAYECMGFCTVTE